MASAIITSKGQVTIPVEIRVRLGLRPGSRIAFVPTATGGYEIHPEAGSIKELKGAVRRPLDSVSIDEMNEAIAAGATADAR